MASFVKRDRKKRRKNRSSGKRDTGRGRRAGGHCRRHTRRTQVVPGSHGWHSLCNALRSKSGPNPSCFAAARTANRSGAQRARRPWRSAQRSAHTGLQRKGSPDSGAGCAARDQLCDVQDERRPGTEYCAARTIVRRMTNVRSLRLFNISRRSSLRMLFAPSAAA